MATAIGLQPGVEPGARQYPPGVIAPAEGTGSKSNPPKLGPNFENLAEVYPDLVSALRELVLSYRVEGIVSRRHEIRRIRQARLYWQGLHYGYFSGADWQWHLPFGTSVGLGLGVEDAAEEETPRYQFVTNIYQAFGLAFIALMSASIPTPTYHPVSAQNELDITMAKAADDVRKVIEKNHRPKSVLAKIAHTFWTDGKVGGYVRYVADGQRFGWDDANQVEPDMVNMGPAAYVCPQCGHENEEDGENFGVGAPMFCEECGAELSDDNLRAPEMVAVPRVTSTQKVPKGQEVISIIGGLEFHTPPWADEMHEFPYLQWNLEVHIAKLKAAYQHVASKITATGPVSADDVFARASRISVKQGLPSTHPGDALANLVTFSRTWIRPWCFWLIDNEGIREQAINLFPRGCYIAFAGETYCEARNEAMDNSWRVCLPMPGDGQNRPSVGDSMIQIQEQYNTLSNIEAETYEFGIPPIYADQSTLDFDAIEGQTSEPAVMYPINVKGGESAADKFFQPNAATVPADAIKRRQELMGPIGQFLTGIMPAVYGGKLEGNDTAAAYAMAREQAMGRLGLFWNAMKMFWAELVLLAIECFRANRPEDVEHVIANEGGEFESRFIRLADLRGHIQIYDDPDESMPELPSQVRAMLQTLLGDPAIGQMLLKEPANLGTAKRVFGLSDFVIPGEDSRTKQLREIEQLLESTEGPIQPPPMMDEFSGQMAPQEPQPTVQVDPVLDDHAAEYAECLRWANSDAGQQAKQENPGGFLNIRAHAIFHKKFMMADAQALVPAQPQPGGQHAPAAA